MSDPTPPTKQPHHGYESWTSSWRDDNRKPHTKRFGRVGKVTKAQAVNLWKAWLNTEYEKIKARQSKRYPVAKLCDDYFEVVQTRYVRDGKHTSSVNRHKVALESLTATWGDEEADEMTAGKVSAWLATFLLMKRKYGGEGAKTKETANVALSYVKRMFIWGMIYKGVSDRAAGSVKLVENIRGDHQGARQKDRIQSVAWEVVEKTCKKLNATVRAMVELQWWTGMRPGEVRSMRPCDIDCRADVWIYSPPKHKTTWRGKTRHIAIGPHARDILAPLLPPKTDQFIFRKASGKPYVRQDYAKAIAKAARDAGVHEWAPNRLRHSFATRVRMLQGSQAVQDLLGHATLNQQQVYIDDTIQRAKHLAKEVG